MDYRGKIRNTPSNWFSIAAFSKFVAVRLVPCKSTYRNTLSYLRPTQRFVAFIVIVSNISLVYLRPYKNIRCLEGTQTYSKARVLSTKKKKIFACFTRCSNRSHKNGQNRNWQHCYMDHAWLFRKLTAGWQCICICTTHHHFLYIYSLLLAFAIHAA